MNSEILEISILTTSTDIGRYKGTRHVGSSSLTSTNDLMGTVL